MCMLAKSFVRMSWVSLQKSDLSSCASFQFWIGDRSPCAVDLVSWKFFQNSTLSCYKTVVCDGTNYFIVTEVWDLCVHSLKRYKKCLALSFSKWHDTLHPFRAFDIPNGFCSIDNLPRGQWIQVTWSEKNKAFPFEKYSTSKITCAESLHYSASNFFLRCFFVPIFFLIYVFFLKLCCSECL